jgi:hypothetical protein
MTTNDDSQLDQLFRSYRAACPDLEPSANFMPALWQKIEVRHSFWFVFERLARTAMTGCAALCLLLLVLNVVTASQNHLNPPSYVDALMEEHSAEKTYYTEAIRTTPAVEQPPAQRIRQVQ